MFESILYFLLGFLAAGLLALMVSPMIWQRAVSLTKKRIERSVPLTLNEIQADKDQLRAEFAMSTRRLEISVEELREKAATQIIEINRKRDDVARLAEEHGEKLLTIEELQTKSGELRVQLRQREEQLENTNNRLTNARESLDEKALQLEQMRQRFEKAQTDSDSNKIELVAKQTELDNLSDKLQFQEIGAADNANEIKTSADASLAKTKASLKAEIAKREIADSKLKEATSQITNLSDQLERRERELSRQRESTSNDDATNSELTSQLVNTKSHNVELEAKLAQANLQMESLLHDASNENVEKAMSALEKQKTNLSKKLKDVSAERDKLAEDLNHLSNASGENWETERRENSILRERINDLAAQVTSMTAALEGDKSPINEILARKDNTKRTRSNKSNDDKPISLAERIRALQDAAG